MIKTVYDPEIPVDIYELGLIYDIIVDKDRNVLINMSLTSPACPSAQQLPVEVRHKVRSLPEVTDAKVEIVWEPAWTKDRMSEAAKLTLGFFSKRQQMEPRGFGLRARLRPTAEALARAVSPGDT